MILIAANDFRSLGHHVVTMGDGMSERIAKLTKRVVDAAQPEDERYVIRDSALKGFGLRVEASGTKTFLVRYWLPAENASLRSGALVH